MYQRNIYDLESCPPARPSRCWLVRESSRVRIVLSRMRSKLVEKVDPHVIRSLGVVICWEPRRTVCVGGSRMFLWVDYYLILELLLHLAQLDGVAAAWVVHSLWQFGHQGNTEKMLGARHRATSRSMGLGRNMSVCYRYAAWTACDDLHPMITAVWFQASFHVGTPNKSFLHIKSSSNLEPCLPTRVRWSWLVVGGCRARIVVSRMGTMSIEQFEPNVIGCLRLVIEYSSRGMRKCLWSNI